MEWTVPSEREQEGFEALLGRLRETLRPMGAPQEGLVLLYAISIWCGQEPHQELREILKKHQQGRSLRLSADGAAKLDQTVQRIAELGDIGVIALHGLRELQGKSKGSKRSAVEN